MNRFGRMTAWVVAAAFVNIGCVRSNPSHCGNQQGDQTCLDRFVSTMYCDVCESSNDGCVDAMPVDNECRFDPIAGGGGESVGMGDPKAEESHSDDGGDEGSAPLTTANSAGGEASDGTAAEGKSSSSPPYDSGDVTGTDAGDVGEGTTATATADPSAGSNTGASSVSEGSSTSGADPSAGNDSTPITTEPDPTADSNADDSSPQTTGIDPTNGESDPSAGPGATDSDDDDDGDPTDPTADPTDPTADPTDPTADPTDPTADPTDPTADPTDPTDGGNCLRVGLLCTSDAQCCSGECAVLLGVLGLACL